MNDECKISSYSEHIAKHLYIASISLEQLLVNNVKYWPTPQVLQGTYLGQDKERGRYNTCRYFFFSRSTTCPQRVNRIHT